VAQFLVETDCASLATLISKARVQKIRNKAERAAFS